MAQLGQVVKRIVYLMALHIHHGLPFKFNKLDVKDRFWIMIVAIVVSWNFSYVLPSIKYCKSLYDTELVVTNSLQMGWCEIPPLFWSGSETTWDLMERLLIMELPPQKFEEVMLQRISRTYVNKHYEGLVTLLEVYVDEFISMSNAIRHSHMGSTRSSPHLKARSILGLNQSQIKKWVTVKAYGTSTKRSLAGNWTA